MYDARELGVPTNVRCVGSVPLYLHGLFPPFWQGVPEVAVRGVGVRPVDGDRHVVGAGIRGERAEGTV